MIHTEGLVRTYRVNDHRTGRWAALRDLAAPRYHEITALNGVDVHADPGEVVAVIGPNGAGKSTLVKILCGVLVPTAGDVRVCGLVPHRSRTKLANQIGVMFGQRTQLWWDLPVIDTLRLYQTMYAVPEKVFQQRLKDFDDLLEIGQLLTKPVRQLSLGQKTRAEIALCLLHSPELIFLDEPTIGLDVFVKERLRAFLKEINRSRGTTILLTSHDMGDVEEICRRVIIIGEGSVLFDGSLDAVKQQYIKERVVKVTLTTSTEPPEWPDVRVVSSERLVHTLAFRPEIVPVKDLLSRIVSTLPVADIALEDPGIESVVKQMGLDESRQRVSR